MKLRDKKKCLAADSWNHLGYVTASLLWKLIRYEGVHNQIVKGNIRIKASPSTSMISAEFIHHCFVTSLKCWGTKIQPLISLIVQQLNYELLFSYAWTFFYCICKIISFCTAKQDGHTSFYILRIILIWSNACCIIRKWILPFCRPQGYWSSE